MVTFSFADTESPPFDYVAQTKKEQFEFRMFVPNADTSDATNRISGLYPNSTESSKPLWSVDWYAFNVVPHSNGQNLVRHGPWATWTSQLAVAFYKNGEELRTYQISDLITDPSKLIHSVSHFQWRSKVFYQEENETLTIYTVDGNRYVFSLLSGELTERNKTEHDNIAELKNLVKGQPDQIQFAARSIIDNRKLLLELMQINAAVFNYLPEELK